MESSHPALGLLAWQETKGEGQKKRRVVRQFTGVHSSRTYGTSPPVADRGPPQHEAGAPLTAIFGFPENQCPVFGPNIDFCHGVFHFEHARVNSWSENNAHSPRSRLILGSRLWSPPLSQSEIALLKESLLREGLREPLIVWKETNILLDGHNRHRLCQELGIKPRADYRSFPDREAAKVFILRTQLQRRNLSPEGVSYVQGKQYLEMRQQGFRADLASGQFDQKTTAERLAKEFRVGEKTIRRDAKFALAVEAIVENCGEKAKQQILSRDVGLRRQQVLQLAKMSAPEQRTFLKRLADTGRPPRRRRASKRTSITLPADPQALVAALVRQVSREQIAQVAKLLQQALKKQSNSE